MSALHDAAKAAALAERDLITSQLDPACGSPHATNYVVGRIAEAVIRVMEGRAVEPECTGVTATWCPRCGNCSCPRHDDGEVEFDGEKFGGGPCRLHDPVSTHGEPAVVDAASEELNTEPSRVGDLLAELEASVAAAKAAKRAKAAASEEVDRA